MIAHVCHTYWQYFIWCPSGDGRVLLYDLTRDTEHPVKTLDVCGVSAPVFDLAFNVRAPELFATTDQQCVKVSSEWRPL